MLINVQIVGTRPLLQNDSFEESTTVKSSKVYDAQEEAKKRLILDGDVICQKASHLEGTMVKSAVDFKFKGKKTYKDLFKSAIFVNPRMIPHLIPEWELDKQQVLIQRSRVMRSRPRFDKWELEFQIENLDSTNIEFNTIKQVLENAGQFIGIGDYRPRYGLFKVASFDLVE